jgi:hypothetical protein
MPLFMLHLLTVTISGTRVAIALEAVPEESTIPYLSYTVSRSYILPPTFSSIPATVLAVLKNH